MFLNIIAAKIGRRKVSDIEFMSKKEFDGKIIKANGFRDSTTGAGVVTSVTPASGKFFYLARAGISQKPANNQPTVTLRNNAAGVDVIEEDTSRNEELF